MRTITLILLTLFAALGLAWWIHVVRTQGFDPGYVIVGWGRWSLESSLVLWLILLLLAAIALGFLGWFLIRVIRLPHLLRRHKARRLSRKSHRALVQALIDEADGNLEAVEQTLIKHAANSGVPLMHYLTAARAAHSRGALEERDTYLRMAYENFPDAEVAVGLVHADLQLSSEEFQEALENLTRLRRMAPRQAAVLRRLHEAYARMDDWESVRRLIPEMHAQRVLMEADIKLLETETYSGLLRQRAQTRNPAAVEELWQSIPHHIRKLSGLRSLYFAAMIESGAGEQVEEALRAALDEEWDTSHLVLYGMIEMRDTAQQLVLAERWLLTHPEDPVLLRVLGRIALHGGEVEKSAGYLRRSLGFEPSVEAYQLLGELWVRCGDYQQAAECYRRGLMLASSELVKQAEDHAVAVLPAEAA